MGEETPRALVLRRRAGTGAGRRKACDRSLATRMPRAAHHRGAGADRPRRPCRRPAPCPGRYSRVARRALRESFGESWVEEGAALALRPPLDLRVNRLKAEREKVAKALAQFGAAADGARAGRAPDRADRDGRPPPQRPGRARLPEGLVRDPGRGQPARAADGCGEAGRADPRPLRRLRRQDAGARRGDGEQGPGLRDRLRPRAPRPDLRPAEAGGHTERPGAAGGGRARRPRRPDGCVLLDVPCTGTGTWRRRPDAKWRLTERALNERIADQTRLLDQAVRFVKPGGRIVYITCSMLPRRERRPDRGLRCEARPSFSVIAARRGRRAFRPRRTPGEATVDFAGHGC